MNTLHGRTAIVTGAASGIGRAIAIALRVEGARLVLLDRDGDGLQHVATKDDHAITVDLADRGALARAAEAALAVGDVDILVNAAGIAAAASMLDTTEALWDSIQAINSTAPFLLMQIVGRHMVARARGGRIVNVTSSAAHRALGSQAAYGASKAALGQLTRVAAAELAPFDINVNAVAPGLTRTPMVDRSFSPEALAKQLQDGPLANLLHRISEPEDVAAVVLFLCQPASRQLTGQTLHVSAGAIV